MTDTLLILLQNLPIVQIRHYIWMVENHDIENLYLDRKGAGDIFLIENHPFAVNELMLNEEMYLSIMNPGTQKIKINQ